MIYLKKLPKYYGPHLFVVFCNLLTIRNKTEIVQMLGFSSESTVGKTSFCTVLKRGLDDLMSFFLSPALESFQGSKQLCS